MSQINVNVVAPIGYTGTQTGDDNYVQIVDLYGDSVFKVSAAQNHTFIGGSNPADTVYGVYVGRFAGSAMTYNNVGPSVAVGDGALGYSSQTGSNVAVGPYALQNTTGVYGIYNVGVGAMAGNGITDGQRNTLIGNAAGYAVGGVHLSTGSNNIVIGDNASTTSSSSSNSVTLGNSSITLLRCAVTSITSLSDARDKKDVTDLRAGLDFVNKLKPVEFVWDDRDENGKHEVSDFGFIAQDLKAAQEEAEMSEVLKLIHDENPEKLEASYGKLIPILVKAIQDLSAKVEKLENKKK